MRTELPGKILFHRTFAPHSTHRMFIWTPDRIRSIAPDENTWERARRLAHPPVWRNQSGNEAMVWGECKGSGGSFYQTAIDWNGPAYRCSCPVKRMPCKHILALMLLLHNYSDHFRVTHDLPDWAEQWRAARLKRQAKSASPEQEANRSAQREKKRDQRLDVMAAGIEELDKWLRDMVRQGIAEAENRPASFWEQTAARMTDAKLGSIARRLRMPAFPVAGQSRHLQILNELGDLFLLVEAFRKLDQLPEGMQQDVLTACGVAQRKSDLDGQPGISDRWVVMGQEEGEEEQLRFRRVCSGVKPAGVLRFCSILPGATPALKDTGPPALFLPARCAIFLLNIHSGPWRAPCRMQIFQITTYSLTIPCRNWPTSMPGP
ncbi:MAG TPA: SWIM zinc finger family protein [Saprospiraceae bacterium]|nr:SWIM zinc finger family protein [Saprospiraceae bacterium]